MVERSEAEQNKENENEKKWGSSQDHLDSIKFTNIWIIGVPKEEDVGNLLEKEFRVMLLKMIQNTRNKMEAQMNKIEAQIRR